jgi:hypothetical protein
LGREREHLSFKPVGSDSRRVELAFDFISSRPSPLHHHRALLDTRPSFDNLIQQTDFLLLLLSLLHPFNSLPGFPPRLIIFFSLLILILFFTGSIPLSPSSSSSSHSSGSAASSHALLPHSHALKPHDYLNASLADPAPFPFCPVYGPGDEVANRRGQLGLLKTRLHSGTGARVQKVIRKALSGAPLTISVLGASGQSSFLSLDTCA